MFDINNAFNKAGELLKQGKYVDVFPICDEIIRNGYDILEVYLLRLLAEANKNDIRELANLDIPLQEYQSFQKAVSLADSEMSNYLRQCNENSLLNYNKREEATKLQKSNATNVTKGTMRAITCELCGSNEIIKNGGFFVCQHCGTKYTLEEARKMMIEGRVDVSGSTVHIDTSDELRNLYQIARRARHDGNNEKAQQYYDQITVKDPSSWEASFYSTYYQSMNCKIAEIGAAANRVIGCERTVLKLIKDNLTDQKEQSDAVLDVSLKLMSISTMLFNSYKSYYDGLSASLQSEYLSTYVRNCGAARDIVYYGGDQIIWTFGETYSDLAVSCWKAGVIKDNILNCGRYNEGTNSYNQKIVKYDPSYKAPEMKKGGCYIATSVYGSYNCPQVWTLRRYRDYELAKTWYGRAFIKIYYTVSPTFVNWFGDTEWFKNMWRRKLDKMVTDLKKRGFDDTPYEDRFY